MIQFENSKGVKNRRAKLTPEAVAEMRRRRDAGEKPKEIVKDYDTTVGYVRQLTKKNATRWR